MRAAGRLLLTALMLLPNLAPAGEPIRVAAAADTQFVLPPLVSGFEQRTGNQVSVSFGSSGNLSAQIQNGAPFDVFLSADTAYASKLVQSGLADRESLYEYAQGKLALWVPANSSLDLSHGLQLLADPRVKRIAIANPQHAPYGKAAVAALQASGIYGAIKAKLVLGENVAQAFQFVSSGNAEVGLLSLSLVKAAQTRGSFSLVPENLYPAIRQSAVVLNHSQHRSAAFAFLAFLKTQEAKALLEKFGLSQEPSPMTMPSAREKQP